VTLCVRRPFERLVIRGLDGTTLEPDVRIVTDPAAVGPVDWVLLATKAHQTPAALAWLTPLARRPDGGEPPAVAVLQNGVRQRERVSALLPGAQVLPTVVYVGAEVIEPGVVEQRTYGFLEVPDEPLGHRLATILPGPREIRPRADFAVAAWTKLVSNAAVNSLTALTGRRLEVLRRQDVGAVALTLMRECVAVARADGAPVPPAMAEQTLQRVRGLVDGVGTSMLYDRLAGRPMEHEELVGAVVRIGAEHGVPTPVSALVLALLDAVSEAATGP
jgi:2-dehydropantoate 2-reductase